MYEDDARGFGVGSERRLLYGNQSVIESSISSKCCRLFSDQGSSSCSLLDCIAEFEKIGSLALGRSRELSPHERSREGVVRSSVFFLAVFRCLLWRASPLFEVNVFPFRELRVEPSPACALLELDVPLVVRRPFLPFLPLENQIGIGFPLEDSFEVTW